MTTFNGLTFLGSGGETGSLIRAFNWSDTPLGPIKEWSHSLKVALQILLSSRFPMQILWGPDYIQFYNDAYIAIAGKKHPRGLGQRAAECWQEVWDFSGPLLDRVMATGEATWSEDQLLILNRNEQAEECYFTFSYTPIWDEFGKVGGIFIAVNETTQKILGERRERALRAEAQAARENLENVLNTAPASIAQCRFFANRTYIADYHSVGCEALTGYTPAEVTPELWLSRIFPEDRDAVFDPMFDAVFQQKPITVEYRFRHKDGTVRWIADHLTSRWNEAQNCWIVTMVGIDITDRKQAEAALRQSEERYRYLIEVTPQLVWTADAEGRNSYVSQQMGDYTGLPSEQLLDYNWRSSIHPDDVERVYQRWMESVHKSIPYEAEYRLRNSDGAYRWQLVRAMPLRNEQGQIVQWFGVSTDIHDKQELEKQRSHLLQQTQAAREEAERANRLKDEFLAVLSHELRSPLNPILGWAKLLRMQTLNATKTEYALEVIERNAKLQAQLIDDLLDVSRILQGKLALDITSFSLASVIKDALEVVRSAAEAKGVHIQIQPDAAPFQVSGDSNRLQQVVWNLLSNAVKFTPPGGQVSVRLNYLDNMAQIQISDTGKGIDPDFLPHVFDRFRQADSTTTRVFGGLGLGLAIAHQIVEMHGGRIQAESPGEGQGATFTVQFPLISGATKLLAQDSCSAALHDLQDVHVLVVEDDADSRDLIVTTLQEFGAKTTAVSSAVAAITILSSLKPDILISDIGMPDMDGYVLMQQIREVTHTSEIPAIALTSYTSDMDQQRALTAGFQKHLSKPIEPIQLVEAISMVLRNSARTG